MIHFVIGTKAQLIKMAPVMCALRDSGVEYNYISTGQHRDTMDEILSNFDLRGPDRTLYSGADIVSIPSMFLWALRILWITAFRRRDVFLEDKKGVVLVHGDTFSTLLGAIMAKLGGLSVGHVESGLRSFNLFHPFPEELTRLAVFRLSDVMFCPDENAKLNLEKYSGRKVVTQGNTLKDSLRNVLNRISESDSLETPATFGIVTLHRFENLRNRAALLRVVELVEEVANYHKLLFILHKPTERKLNRFGFYQRLKDNPNIELRPRYDYLDFMRLTAKSSFVVSDGGSNQEECSYLGKPILLLRNATERQEGLGRNCLLSGYDVSKVVQFARDIERYKVAPATSEANPSLEIAQYCISRFTE